LSSPGHLDSLEKANVQRLVNNVSEKNIQLDSAEDDLTNKLIEFTEFFSITTPRYETKLDANNNEMFDDFGEPILDKNRPIEIPYQFRRENHAKFKAFSIPISRSMWAVSKVISHMRQELYAHETPMPPMSQLPMGPAPDKGILNTIKDFGKKLYRDPNSPYNVTKDELTIYSEIPEAWYNMLHIYELNIRHRPKINTRAQLDRILDDIVIIFSARIEPYLLQLVHQAILILKAETEDKIVSILTTYNQIEERHAKMMMGMGMSGQQPQNG